MEDLLATYESLMARESVADLDGAAALQHIEHLVELSQDLGKPEGARRATKLCEELQERELSPPQAASLFYFTANVWEDMRRLSRTEPDQIYAWEQQEIEKGIVCLRRAMQSAGFKALPQDMQCQVLTNLGNLLSHIGRFVEAVEYWDRALAIVPSFGMARGNKGFGLSHYARCLYDDGHARLFLKIAHSHLRQSLSLELEGDARKGFTERIAWIESKLSPESPDQIPDLEGFSLGETNEEIRYRMWCLENRLFLNPLNDLEPFSVAGRDILTAPSIVMGIGEGPYYHGFFNEMKQEFASARYICYEGLRERDPHFSDRGVLLYNTLDYPAYSLAAERTRVAFRMAYSLFDKIAFFLNHYLHLGIPEWRINFRTLWYVSKGKRRALKQPFRDSQNWPLRGLFWVSKDLYEDVPGFREALEPDAQELADIRNHLEHKYLKLHDDLWPGPPAKEDETPDPLVDRLALSVYRQDFECKTLRILKTVRAALIYLVLAVHIEERQRAKGRGPGKTLGTMPLDVWEDDWKT
jgi:hypothetical protein